MAERSNPDLYLLSHHKAPSLTIALPKNATFDKNQVTLTKLRGNCPLQTPKTQTLPVSWQEAAPSSDANQGEPKYVAAIPYLQSREIWNEQLQGCDFEIKIQGQVAGQPHEFKVILDARFCSDGEHTQLSQFAKDCQVRGPTRNYPKVTTLPAHHSHGLR
jgi:hypothetical protein